MSRDSCRILFFSILPVIDETAFLYIACTEWSRDESSETFSKVQYRWSSTRRRSRAAQPAARYAQHLWIVVLCFPGVGSQGLRSSGLTKLRCAQCAAGSCMAASYAAHFRLQGGLLQSSKEKVLDREREGKPELRFKALERALRKLNVERSTSFFEKKRARVRESGHFEREARDRHFLRILFHKATVR